MTVAPAGRATSQLEGPTGSLELITTGSGLPATVFAHGLGASIETTRPFGSGVKGSRTFFHFRGHGGSKRIFYFTQNLADDSCRPGGPFLRFVGFVPQSAGDLLLLPFRMATYQEWRFGEKPFADVRPALRQVTGRGSSNDGPASRW